jgi:hypothetical protein
MKEIPLTQNKVAIVDDEDYERLSRYKWYANSNACGNCYARRNIYIGEKRTALKMHREILRMGHRDGFLVDHINRNGLDNRKENIRVTTKNINGHNCKLYKNNFSRFRGVSWYKPNKKWGASIRVLGKKIFCGLYLNPQEAAAAYDVAAVKYYGDAAILNFPKL